MATKKSGSVMDTADWEIVTTRVFDAPREWVFQAWTDPKQLEIWWGPDGFTNTTHQINVRPGGVWRFIMHGPDGVDYSNRIDFEEIVKPERIVYSHSGGGKDASVAFHVMTPEIEHATKGAKQGWTMTLDQLEAHCSR